MPNPRIAHCVFCDDVRYETGNKLSLMGIYSGEIGFPHDPPSATQLSLPKFVICWWLFCDIDDPPQRVSVNLYMPPDRTEVLKFAVPPEHLVSPAVVFEDAIRLTLSSVIPIVNLTFAREGRMEVTIETERETLRAGRLRIRISGRPGSQSEQSEFDPPASSGQHKRSRRVIQNIARTPDTD